MSPVYDISCVGEMDIYIYISCLGDITYSYRNAKRDVDTE